MCGTGAVVMVMLPVTPHVHESVDGAVVGVDFPRGVRSFIAERPFFLWWLAHRLARSRLKFSTVCRSRISELPNLPTVERFPCVIW